MPEGKGSPQRAGEDSSSRSALLIVDIVSNFEFEDGDRLHDNLMHVAGNIAELRERAVRSGTPVIYVNDNFGKWQEDFTALVEDIMSSSKKGAEVLRQLAPGPDDYYVLKPQRSAFYETPLDVLLGSLNVSRIVLTGVTTDICILFTAHDAYMRGFSVAVPADCSAAVESEYHEAALKLIGRVIHADTGPGSEVILAGADPVSKKMSDP